jgi:hypothetical protein
MASTGIKMTHISYKGPGPATQDVLAAVVPCGFLATPVVMPHVMSGKLVVSQRPPQEVAYRSRRSDEGRGRRLRLRGRFRGGSARLQGHFVDRSHLPQRGTTRILQQPDVRDRMMAVDLEFVPNTPQQANERLHREGTKWKEIIGRLGLRAD